MNLGGCLAFMENYGIDSIDTLTVKLEREANVGDLFNDDISIYRLMA